MSEERAMVVCLWSGAGVEGDAHRPNVGAIITTLGSKWEDQTGVPGGSVTYSVMVEATTAELDLIDALTDAVIEWREPIDTGGPTPAVVGQGPGDLPDAAAFGQFISATVPFLYINANEARAIFGPVAAGRSWAQISQDGITNQRIAGGV